MKNCKAIACLLLFVLAFIVAAAAADGPPLKFTFKKFDVKGSVATSPGGINNKGVTVGGYTDKGLINHGFILQGTKLTKLDDPKGKAGTTGASNLALNGPIAVVGTYVNSAGSSVGFLFKNKKYKDIPGPKGAIASIANAINDHGDIVGAYLDSSAVQHGYVLKGTKYTTLDPPGTSSPAGNGINNKGNVVIATSDSCYLYTAATKKYKKINVPGATTTACLDMNTGGDVSYVWSDSAGAQHGALLHAGKYYKFDFPHSAFTYAGAVNDVHVIVGGYALTSSGSIHGFTASFK
jgi:uncharacterized membrane protein